MVSQNGIKYAVHIVSTNFGDLVAKVCECLLRRGPLTYQNISRSTEISPPLVKNCLLLLIQHNCVQAFSLEPAGDAVDLSKPINTEYIAFFDNIIHRTRFSKFIATVSEELDEECVELFQGLLQHGRLSLKKMIDRAKSGRDISDDCAVEGTIRGNLAKLLDSRFVERCPAGEAVLSPPAEEGTGARKRGAKSSKIVAKSITIEERIVDASAPMEAKRFLFTIDADSNKTSENSSEVLHGEKRKYDSLESERETSADDSHVPWRVNFEEFLHRFRHKACVENVRERLDGGAAIALSAMLEATRSMEKKVKSDKTVPLSINTIYEEVMKKEAGRSMTLDHLRASLALLGCERGSDDLYMIDLKAIIKHAQTEEVEAIVLKRYGRDAYRIFRLLMKTGRLQETDKISGTAFVDKKDTPKILYQLWKDEFLHMEKVIVTTPRQLQLLLWKVNRSTLWPHLLDEMYHTALNLSQRVAYEIEQENEILNLPPRVELLKKRFIRLGNVRMLLDSSLMRLDDALMLFHDF